MKKRANVFQNGCESEISFLYISQEEAENLITSSKLHSLNICTVLGVTAYWLYFSLTLIHICVACTRGSTYHARKSYSVHNFLQNFFYVNDRMTAIEIKWHENGFGGADENRVVP